MLFDPFNRLDRLSDAFFSAFATGGLGDGAWRTPVNLRREKDRYVVEADLPGVDRESIDVSVDGGWLTIRAERSNESQNQDARWLVRERSSEAVVRRLALGQDVDIDAIAASYDNGVLTVELPILAGAQPRRIEVNAGSSAGQRSIGSGASAAPAAETAEVGAGKAQPAHSLAS